MMSSTNIKTQTNKNRAMITTCGYKRVLSIAGGHDPVVWDQKLFPLGTLAVVSSQVCRL
jgi:hypothetical protein